MEVKLCKNTFIKNSMISNNRNENNKPEKIFEAVGIKVEKDENGFFTLSEYRQPTPYFSYSDLGIDESKLLENVREIKGNANFVCSSLKSLHGVEKVHNLLLGSSIKDLGALKEVGGNLFINSSNLETLGGLKIVHGDLYIGNCKSLRSLGNLKQVGQDLRVHCSDKLHSLGSLARVGRNLILCDSKVTDIGELEQVGGDAWFNDTQIRDVSKLKFVGEFIYHRNSPLKSSDISHIKRNHGSLFYLWNRIWYCQPDAN